MAVTISKIIVGRWVLLDPILEFISKFVLYLPFERSVHLNSVTRFLLLLKKLKHGGMPLQCTAKLQGQESDRGQAATRCKKGKCVIFPTIG
jgi:hypothetical protein